MSMTPNSNKFISNLLETKQLNQLNYITLIRILSNLIETSNLIKTQNTKRQGQLAKTINLEYE